MLTIKKVDKKFVDAKKIKHCIKTLFPRGERAPFWFLCSCAKKSGIDFLAFYDSDGASEMGDVFVGYAYIITLNNRTLVFNLCVDYRWHSKGYGSAILEYVKTAYAPNPIDLNIEALTGDCNNAEQRQKRKAFYIKNGFIDGGCRCVQLKQPYEMLSTDGCFNLGHYKNCVRYFAGRVINCFIKPKEMV